MLPGGWYVDIAVHEAHVDGDGGQSYTRGPEQQSLTSTSQGFEPVLGW